MEAYDITDWPDQDWPNRKIVGYIDSVQVDKFLAFAMGGHARLGERSLVGLLDSGVLCAVMLCYLGLPVFYLDALNRSFEYQDVLKRAEIENWMDA